VASFDDEALILAGYPYGDRHLVISMLTRHHGEVRGVLRGGRGGKAPRTSATQVLSLVRVGVSHAPTAELATIRRLDLVRSSFPLARSFEGGTAAAVVAELLGTFCPPGDSAERPFRLGAAVLDALLAETDPHVAVAYAQFWLLALGGVLPPFDRCTRCGTALDQPLRTVLGDGQPVCASCASGETESLAIDSLRFLAACRQHPVKQVAGPVPETVGRWLDLLSRLEADKPLRALDFLRRHGQARS